MQAFPLGLGTGELCSREKTVHSRIWVHSCTEYILLTCSLNVHQAIGPPFTMVVERTGVGDIKYKNTSIQLLAIPPRSSRVDDSSCYSIFLTGFAGCRVSDKTQNGQCWAESHFKT